MQDPAFKPKHRPVSGLAAFWVLLGIALNGMAQPSGRVCGINTEYGRYLRSSPILCGIDALTIVAQLSYYSNRNPNLSDSAKLVLVSRFSDQGSIPRRDDKFLRILVFVFGLLPALITIVTATGIPWTKTWGLLFLADFGVVEIVWFLAGDVQPQPHACDTVCQAIHSDYFGQACVFVHSTCILIYTFFTITTDHLEWMQAPLFGLTVTVFAASTGRLSQSLLFLMLEILPDEFMPRTVPIGPPIGYTVGTIIDRYIAGSKLLWTSFDTSYIISSTVFVTLSALFFRVFARYFYLLTLCLSLSLAIFYYSVQFDPSGTYSPSWEEIIGKGLSG